MSTNKLVPTERLELPFSDPFTFTTFVASFVYVGLNRVICFSNQNWNFCWLRNWPLLEFGRFKVIRKLSTYTIPKQLGSRLSILWLSEQSILERILGNDPNSLDWQPSVIPLYDTRNYNSDVVLAANPEKEVNGFTSSFVEHKTKSLSYKLYHQKFGAGDW